MNFVRFAVTSLALAFYFSPFSKAQDVNGSFSREVIFNNTQAHNLTWATSNTYVPCHFRFADSIYANVSDEKYFLDYSPFTTHCFDINAMHFPNSGVRFDETKKEWVKDFSELSFADNAEFLEILDKASRIYTIEAKNSTGYVYTENELMGEESRRHRILHFCLLHSPIALYGQTDVMLLSEPENDRQPYIMEVLRSIEFIDDVSSEEADTPSSVPAASSASRP